MRSHSTLVLFNILEIVSSPTLSFGVVELQTSLQKFPLKINFTCFRILRFSVGLKYLRFDARYKACFLTKICFYLFLSINRNNYQFNYFCYYMSSSLFGNMIFTNFHFSIFNPICFHIHLIILTNEKNIINNLVATITSHEL